MSATLNEIEFNHLLLPVPAEAKLFDEDYSIWGATPVRGDDGRYHLFYSRWPVELGHNAWVTHSEIAHAVAEAAAGPYVHQDVALPARGAEYWDGLCTHCPNVHKFDGKYYLYYLGNTGDGVAMKGLNWTHRNNQRVGVAVADSPDGPWTRFDEPLIDVGGKGSWDELMTATPAVCRKPDGGYLLIYKCVAAQKELPFGGPVSHMAASAESPLGPFTKHPQRVLTEADQFDFVLEDPYIWVDGDTYWALLKDFKGTYSGVKGSTLTLFTSDNGLDWRPAKHPFVSRVEINWEGREVQQVHRLERPQLLIEDGVPKVLFLSVFEKGNEHNYNIHVPLKGLHEQAP